VQNHYSLLTRTPETDGVLDACGRLGMGFVPYFPLESGVLTGKYKVDQPPPDGTRLAAWGDRAGSFLEPDRLATVARVTAWAEARGHTVLDAAMSWLAGNPRVASIIAGATTPDQVRTNAAAAGWGMAADERAELEALL
jgi:aryl-alcohol dehydrogenase-like predicted oxidoreductase